MISSPSGRYPYPVNDKSSSTRRVVLQPHIYSPSESTSSPKITMYPQLFATGCHSPNYYPGYEQYYYSKDGWQTTPTSSWPPSYYPYPRPSSSSLAVNPKVTILPPQSMLESDVDTPSSLSSHAVLTPTSPFTPHDMNDAMEFDEFECEDEEDYFDSDFADEMEGIDEMPGSPLYGASAPQVTKSTSALAGALGDAPSLSYDPDHGVSAPADRRLSASVPGGYASASYRSAASSSHQRWPEKAHSPVPLTSSPHASSYPSPHTYTHRNDTTSVSSTSLLSHSPPSYDHISTSSSLAGAFASSAPSSYASRHAHVHSHAPRPLPILQPQPIRPIPPIPIADLTSGADENDSDSCRSPEPSPESQARLSPLPLLCQPVSDVVRYQLKEPSMGSGSGGGSEDGDSDARPCYGSEAAPDAACAADIMTPSEQTDGQFAIQVMAFSERHRQHQHHQHHHLHHPSSAGGAYSVVEKLYSSCVSMGSPIRWQ